MPDGPPAESDHADPPPAVGHAVVPDSAKLRPGVPPPDPVTGPAPSRPPATPASPAPAAPAPDLIKPHRGVARVPASQLAPAGTDNGSSADDPPAPPPPPAGPAVAPHPPPASVPPPASAPAPAAHPTPAPPPGSAAAPSTGRSEETSGSFTGFILSRGRSDGPAPRNRLIIIGVVALVMVLTLAGVALFAVRALVNMIIG